MFLFQRFKPGFDRGIVDLAEALHRLLLEKRAIDDVFLGIRAQFHVAITADDFAEALVVFLERFELVFDDVVANVRSVDDECHGG